MLAVSASRPASSFLGRGGSCPVSAASNDSTRGLLTPASAHHALAPCPPPLATRTTNQVERRRPEAPACRPPEVTRQRPQRLPWPLPATSPHLLPPTPNFSPPHLLPQILSSLPISGAPPVVLLKTLISGCHNRRHPETPRPRLTTNNFHMCRYYTSQSSKLSSG